MRCQDAAAYAASVRSPSRLVLLTAIVSALGAIGIATPASAATTAGWASWGSFDGTEGAYTTTMTLPGLGGIAASVTSDSQTGQVGVIDGTSTWLSEGTPPGAVYGSSHDQPYLSLRPRADTPTAPSTTTYSFARPTPASGWMFALAGFDGGTVTIRAIGANGVALTAADLGFQGGFNYCAPGVAGKPSCTGSATDIPQWDPSSLTLTGAAVAAGTDGAAAWFEPTTPITSLSFLFAQQSGAPAYQTWFASIAHDITGTVSKDDGTPLAGVTLSLYSPSGELLTTTQTTPAGTYVFPRVQASAGYTVRVTPPAGLASVGPDGQTVDVSAGDDAADFVLRDIVPFEVSGRVVDQHGDPVPGVQVDVDSPAGTVTTDANGVFRADNVSPGLHTAALKGLPVGYYAGDAVHFPTSLQYDVLNGPVTGLDFTIFKLATLGGVVSAGSRGVPGATVTATGVNHPQVAVVTGADGSYVLRLEPDDYTVTVSPPPGHFVLGSDTRNEDLKVTDVSDADFALGAFGTASGTVTDTTTGPVSGVTVTVSGPGGVTPVSTDAAGGFAFGGLRAGTYEIMLTVPGDRRAVGPTTRTITVTDAGETITGQDFVVTAIAPLDPVTPVPAQPSGGGGGSLPATGSDSLTPLLTAALLLAAGLAATAAAAAARRRRDHRS